MRRERPEPIALLTGRLSDNPRPEAIMPAGTGGKFSLDGTVEPYPGNTIICHVDRSSDAFGELVALQDTLKAGRHARNFTFLPPDSFHMTVFPGVTEQARGTSRWPRGVPDDAPMTAVTAEFVKRVAPVRAPRGHTIKVEGLFAGYSVSVSGATAGQEASLRGLRDRLRDATGIHDPEHDEYGWHITLGYQVAWIDEAAAREVVELSDRLGADFAARVPVIELERPEVCSFGSMHRFDPVALLGPEGLSPLDGRPSSSSRTV